MRKLDVVLLFGSAFILSLNHIACQQQPKEQGNAATEAQNSAPAPKLVSVLDTANVIGWAGAEQITLEEVPGARLMGGELEEEDGVLVYSIDAKHDSAIFEINLDALSGEVIGTEDKTAKITAKGKPIPDLLELFERDRALEAAMDSIPGKLVKWRLTTDGQKTFYSFRIRTASGETTRLLVKAGTLEIIPAGAREQ